MTTPFLIDKPIGSNSEDSFGRKGFAKTIADKIQSKPNIRDAGALAIGINGQWGAGKTSFTNMIKQEIDSRNRIVIDFNPWRSSSSTQIIEDFFELLIDELKPYDPALSNTILGYAKSLTQIDENLLTKAAGKVSEIFLRKGTKMRFTIL